MSNLNPYGVTAAGVPAAFADESARATFIRRTYAHLAGAVGVFVALEAVLFTVVPAATMESLVTRMLSGWSWLLVLGAFMGVSWLARSWANSDASRGMQYAGLGLYVVAEAVVFLPILYMAMRIDPQIPAMAGLLTLVTFGGLTGFVFVTRVDLSWMGKFLFLGGILAMGLIVCSIFFGGFNLGVWFSGAMVGLASGYILYDTSNVMHHYRTEQHVAASLALFASVALLFWYILQLLMHFSSSD